MRIVEFTKEVWKSYSLRVFLGKCFPMLLVLAEINGP